MNGRKYPDEVRSFVIANGPGNNTETLTAMINEHFGTSFSMSNISWLRYKLGAKSGIDTRIRKGQHLSEGSEFRKGHQCHIKGKKWDEWMPEASQERAKAAWFQKGQKPHNWVPVGTEVVKSDGYLWRKIAEPGKWKQVHILLWEKEHGPVPKGMKLTFLDGDSSHISLDNLMLVSGRENRIMNARWNNARTDSSEITKANIGIRRLDERIRAMEEAR